MAKLIALYKQPEDPARFDAYYYGTHVPLAKTVPGLKRYEVSTGPVATPQGASGYHLVAILSFDSFADIQKGLASPEGIATGNDLANFAAAGVDLLVFESKDV
jgi:uncharacterized protein (TIGR02118 family)